jgi:hypothetical protein
MDPANRPFLDSFGPPHPANDYLQRAIVKVNARGEGLWDNLHIVPKLDPAVGRAILVDFLEMACLSTHGSSIQTGRYGITSLPRPWVLLNIEAAASPMLCSGDYWVYRRLLEVYWYLDVDLMRNLATRATENQCRDIQEAGRDFLDGRNRLTDSDA